MADGYRDYGSGVSESPLPISSGGAFSGDGRAYESLVVQADAPVIDWEMNLRSQIGSDYGLRRAAQRWMTSSWLGGDFLERSDPSGSYSYPAATAGNEGKFFVVADDVVMNGWVVRVEYSGTTSSGQNVVTLPSPPSSGTRTDLVLLEVWRALIKAAPEVANKSSTGLILRNGNVKAPDAVNLTDDLIDPNYGVESNARVQVQYRLRVVSGVNIASYIDGIDDPVVVANSVSDFTGPGADGSPTVYGYSVSDGDKGLWVAGLGNSTSAAALGTVDGLMYAQPVCAVMRRNSTAFNRSSNMNGAGLIASGTSGRPDGLFADQVVASDVVDLRRFCTSDFEEVLEKAFQQVLDNSVSTHGAVSALGTVGTSCLFRDDIGNSGHVGNPDGVRRYFGDRGHTDLVAAVHFFGGLPETTVSFTLSSLRLPWNGAGTNVLAQAPTGTNIAYLSGLRIVTASGDYDMFDASSPFYASKVQYTTTVSGVDTVIVTLSSPASSGSAVSVYAELALEYQPGHGLSKNVLSGLQLWAATAGVPAWMDISSWASTSDAGRKSVPDAATTAYDGSQQWVDPGHREQALRHRTNGSQSATLRSVLTPAVVVGTNTLANADTSASFTLKVRDAPGDPFSTVTVTAGPSVLKTTVRDDLNSQFALNALSLTASVVGVNQIKISGTSYVEVGSVGSGSTLNSALGLSAGGQSSGSSAVVLPERLTGDPVTVNDGVNAPYQTTSYTVNTAFTVIELDFPVASGTSVGVTYAAYRPAPIISSTNAYNSFYRSRAVQSLLPPAGTQTLRLVPKAIGRSMAVIAVGPGSPDSPFPFSAPGDQVAVGALPAPDFPESLLDGPANLALENLVADTGFVQLSPYVPYSPSPGQVTLYRDAADAVTDAEGRNFWPRSDSGSTTVYSPSVLAQGLLRGRRHKTAYPVLMELKDDVPTIGQKGMLVLVVFSSWSDYDPENSILLSPTPGSSAAAVFRVRGNALSPRRPTY